MLRTKLKEYIYIISLKLLAISGFTNVLRANNVHSKINVTKKNVVIISPHPDDEIIGCSSVMLDSISNGNTVHVILLTGSESRFNETKEALERLHPKIELHLLNYPDGDLSGRESYITDTLIKQICYFNVNECVLFIPYQKDFHSDHIAAFYSGIEVYRKMSNIVDCFSYRTNHVNLLNDFCFYNTISIAKKRDLYMSFVSQDFLCFNNLFKIRRIYHSVDNELESELFCRNVLDDIDYYDDYRRLSGFKKYENRLSDIHPYKLALNYRNANREFFKNAEH